MDKDIQPSVLVIFGVTGDLARRKLMPALFNMYRRGVLPEKIRIVGFSRRKLSKEEFREMMMQRPHGNQEPRVDNPALSNLKSAIDSYRHPASTFLGSRSADPIAQKTVPMPPSVSADKQSRKEKVLGESSALRLRLEELAQTTDSSKNLSHGSSSRVPAAGSSTQTSNFAKLLSYVKGDFRKKEGYKELNKKLGRQDKEWEFCANKLFYLAVPPKYYEVILDNLDASGLTETCGENAALRSHRQRRPLFLGSRPAGPMAQKDCSAAGVSSRRKNPIQHQPWTRIILEKPFGKDLKSAKALDKRLGELFAEEQIFRVDHYLGKESLQNILAFRFGNAIFEPVWNRDYIDNIQIIASEKLGLKGRVTFYDKVGALRDMVQSHLLQMVAAVASGKPRDYSAEGIRDERVKVLRALTIDSLWTNFSSKQNSPNRSDSDLSNRPTDKDNLTGNIATDTIQSKSSGWPQAESKRAQTVVSPEKLSPSESRAAAVVKGQYKGYKEEKGVDRDSVTETFAALRLFIDNKRWEGVPFYLLTGKKLKKDLTQIVVTFKTEPVETNFFSVPNSHSLNPSASSGLGTRTDSDLPSKPTDKDYLTGNIVTDTTQSNNRGWPQVESALAQTAVTSKKLSSPGSISSKSAANRIVFRIKPEQCISIEVNMKEPGLEMEVAPHKLQLDYGKVHGHKLLAPYERLLVDCMLGDQTLFARTDGVLASWKFIERIRGIWDRGDLEIYEPGSWGPEGARELVEREGRRWYIG